MMSEHDLGEDEVGVVLAVPTALLHPANRIRDRLEAVGIETVVVGGVERGPGRFAVAVGRSTGPTVFAVLGPEQLPSPGAEVLHQIFLAKGSVQHRFIEIPFDAKKPRSLITPIHAALNQLKCEVSIRDLILTESQEIQLSAPPADPASAPVTDLSEVRRRIVLTAVAAAAAIVVSAGLLGAWARAGSEVSARTVDASAPPPTEGVEVHASAWVPSPELLVVAGPELAAQGPSADDWDDVREVVVEGSQYDVLARSAAPRSWFRAMNKCRALKARAPNKTEVRALEAAGVLPQGPVWTRLAADHGQKAVVTIADHRGFRSRDKHAGEAAVICIR